ncbi:MAG: CBS domain-containing protein [Ignavibacteria bacterium]|nr:CBS domain-containing protein [Ignavibacteria bacterium]
MSEEEEIIEEEIQQLYGTTERTIVLNAESFQLPILSLKRIEPVCLEEGNTVQYAMELMIRHNIGCMLITKNKKISGIITEGDIARLIVGAKKHAETLNVEDIMTNNPETKHANDSLAFVLNEMVLGGYRHVPLVDENDIPLAVISVSDIMRYLVSFFSEEILNLPPKHIETTNEREGA